MGLSLKQFVIYTSFLAIGGITGWASGYYLNANHRLPDQISQQLPTVVPEAQNQASSLPVNRASDRATNSNFIAEAVERVGPAVVRIDASRTITRQVPDVFQRPFHRFFDEDSPFDQEQQIEQGTGSGFILSKDGHIVTNAHVVEGADVVTVTLKDGREFDGEVVGIDPITDIAAIKIQAADLPTVKLGSSENLIPGQWAIAIGNPLGLDNTVTAGIISATGRSSSQVGIPDRRVRFIQTDAAINPGNSGGPLLNDQGEVIGINTAIRANAQGLGFAIPIETAQRVAEQLFSSGQVQHPYLGIQMTELSPSLKEQINQEKRFGFQVTQERGVLIIRIVEGSPAAQAGLKPGDVILKVGGNAVTTASEVQDQVEATQIGADLALELNRAGETVTIRVRPSAFPTELLR